MNQAESEKIQHQRSVDKLVVPNDKLTKTVTHLPAEKYAAMLTTGQKSAIDEKIRGVKKPVLTYYWFELVDGYADLSPLDEFAFDVLTVCISAQVAGYDGLTFGEIARVMAGGKNARAMKVLPLEKERIFRVIERMMCTRIHVNLSQLYDTKTYPDMPKTLTSTILPCKILDGVTVNGQRDCTVVKFLDKSPLLTIAQAKGQLLTIPVEVLDVPNQKNTELVTKTKHYVTRRVHESRPKTNKKADMQPRISFDCVFRNVGVDVADRSKRQDVHKISRNVMANLQKHGIIREFDFERVENVYRAIKFRY